MIFANTRLVAIITHKHPPLRKNLLVAIAESAWDTILKKDWDLRQKYQSIVVRCCHKKVIVAIMHEIIITSYLIIKDKLGLKELTLHNSPFKKK